MMHSCHATRAEVVCPLARPSIRRSVRPPVRPSIRLPVRPPARLSARPSVRLAVRLVTFRGGAAEGTQTFWDAAIYIYI